MLRSANSKSLNPSLNSPAELCHVDKNKIICAFFKIETKNRKPFLKVGLIAEQFRRACELRGRFLRRRQEPGQLYLASRVQGQGLLAVRGRESSGGAATTKVHLQRSLLRQ